MLLLPFELSYISLPNTRHSGTGIYFLPEAFFTSTIWFSIIWIIYWLRDNVNGQGRKREIMWCVLINRHEIKSLTSTNNWLTWNVYICIFIWRSHAKVFQNHWFHESHAPTSIPFLGWCPVSEIFSLGVSETETCLHTQQSTCVE